jgi:DNA-binding phage protein
MALTRNFRETIMARARSDAAFREAMLTEAVDRLLAGEIDVCKAMLRDYINATLGFNELAKQTGQSSKSLHRMLSVSGNPTMKHLTVLLQVVQKHEGVSLSVNATHEAA